MLNWQIYKLAKSLFYNACYNDPLCT